MNDISFFPQTQEEFDKLTQEYAGRENTACLFACVKDGEKQNQGVVGDSLSVFVLLVCLIRQISRNTGAEFTDIIGALTEINTMDEGSLNDD